MLVAFDQGSGALTRMERKATQWMIERRPALAASFRLLAPLPKRHDNFVLGHKQRAASVTKISANQVRLRWENLVSEHGGVLPITFTATVTLKDGAVTFESELDNRSSLSVDSVDYPYFGDLCSPNADTVMQAEHMADGAIWAGEIYPHFANEQGYWGVKYPLKRIRSCESQLCLLQTPDQGVYVGMHDPEVRYYLEFTFEQRPGLTDWVNADVPQEDEISGLPVHLQFRCCHFIFAHPKSTVNLAPIVMRSYTGDWHAGIDVYKEWRKTWFVAPKLADWSRDVHSWLQIQIDGSEQDFTIPYREIVKYGEDCAQNGVAAIQLVGWSMGGQDGGDPSLETDPGLGTWQELHDAIAQVQAKGVKMILFGKPTFAVLSSDLYKKELYKYAATDPYGDNYEHDGFGYNTTTSLANINCRRRAIMDVCSPAYRDIATREFQKIVALGADGWLFDEVLEHNGVLYSFSEDHGYKGPGYLFGGDMPLARQFRAAADKVSPDFLFSGEGPQDWMMQYYPLGYYRIGAGTRHVSRYIDSQAPLMTAIRGFNAREELNLVLLYRYIISYEPYNFKGRLTDFPLTLAYGKKIDALRRKYREWLWDAEFRDTMGAEVSADGSHRYSVYRTAAGKRAVVIVSWEKKNTITATLNLPNAGRLVMATPEELDSRAVTGALQIPPRSAVVVMEE
ncbi:MAG TPA: hypothetical protein VGU25_03920 [Acidobacteriaceae bacterium]|nr:hypothetical protein [Acidobacteriaceae bacterium]